MGVKTYNPGCSVWLTKTITHNVSVSSIDLTPYLGEGGHVTTTKDLYAPKGRFEISLPDKPYDAHGGDILDTLYALIEPMDQIEIRMARNRYQYPDQPPIIMWGLVRDITRQESMGSDGKPQRFVRISGDDYGALGEIVQLSLLAGGAVESGLLPVLRPEALGLKDTVLPAVGMMDTLLNVLLNQQALDAGVKTLSYRPGDVRGKSFLGTLTADEGTAWSIMHRLADKPWNELFIEDDESGPALVFRPTPFKDLSQNMIENTGVTPSATEISDTFDFVRSASYRRSDGDVANILWAAPRALSFDHNKDLAHALKTQRPDVVNTDYINCQKSYYGARMQMYDTIYLPDAVDYPLNNQKDTYRENKDYLLQWAEQRRMWLIRANEDNVVLENGVLTVRGNEHLKPGVYYTVVRGQFAYTHYVTRVSHTFSPFQGYSTEIGFIRSDNFVQRLESPGAPYLLEGKWGVY